MFKGRIETVVNKKIIDTVLTAGILSFSMYEHLRIDLQSIRTSLEYMDNLTNEIQEYTIGY